jgi:hypothetical protein
LLRLFGILGLDFTGNLKCPTILKRLLKMKKYNEEYFSVIETKTGRKIVDCGLEEDALAMVSFDPQNRTYTRNKFLMGPVVDIEIPKALPTNEIVDLGGKWDDPIPEGIDPYNLRGRQPLQPVKKQLPEDQRIPLNTK